MRKILLAAIAQPSACSGLEAIAGVCESKGVQGLHSLRRQKHSAVSGFRRPSSASTRTSGHGLFRRIRLSSPVIGQHSNEW
jgi:hypothetical protein